MSLGMDVTNLRQQYNKLQANFSKFIENDTIVNWTSPEYVLSESAILVINLKKKYRCPVYIYLKLVNLHEDDVLTYYAIKFTSNKMELVNKTFIANDGAWNQVFSECVYGTRSFDVSVESKYLDQIASPLATFHEDTDLTDFELRSEDGSVRMHRVVLAVASPVLRRMLSGKWRETSEGHVEVSGTSKATLQKLKDFLYLHTLPEDGLQQLLLLAKYYMIKELEQRCVFSIGFDLTAENLCDFLEFSLQHKVKRLLLAIFAWVKIEENVKEMRKYLIGSESDLKQSESDLKQSASPFATLHEDTDLTDFELRSQDGLVRMHRLVLAAASPVLRSMLSGKWRETSEGHVEVSGTSKATLQKLKDFLYLHTLPEDGLKQLLLLAKYYMIKDLEQGCVFKIVNGLTTENVCDSLEFALQHNIKRLLMAIIEWVHSGWSSLNFKEMHKYLSEVNEDTK